jgi:endonuclease/exonuclease/phosphatase (EEP) superfamily protein YafD
LSAPLPESFEVLIWNIEKGKHKLKWQNDFLELNRKVHLSLLQEAMMDGFIDMTLKSQVHQNWSFSVAFKTNSGNTGVATGVSSPIVRFATAVSPVTEPVTKTPKVSQIKIVELKNGEKLLVINIHAINFVSQSSFEKHIDSLLPVIRSHSGPIIWAGDFNTWSESRQKYLDTTLGKLNLTRIPLQSDTRGLKLDHIYLRGCISNWAKIENQINTSDHYPIRANILCSKSEN